jgi:hydrogenase maturation protein HypF
MSVGRQKIEIEGIVQGVGFRPFVYQTAVRLGLSGWVNNDSRGVTIEVEGAAAALVEFGRVLCAEHPPLASIGSIRTGELPATGASGFAILESSSTTGKTARISPDTFVCADCLNELFDPADRRFGYPFINCTNCGPRYTIIRDIPYDRPNTTMVDFPMCPACQAEYDDPHSRRFHAQPNACADCGPTLSLTDREGMALPGEPLAETIALLRQGRILAIKGLGGYHLAVDAANDMAVAELRRRKVRDEKPFALMSFDLERVASYAEFAAQEARLLQAVERPIVLLRQMTGHRLSPLIAPHNRYFGVMLPYTPLHYLLLKDFSALVMTSGNQSDEPIAFNDADARQRLAEIADAFLQHDRLIHVRTDDSIARVMAGQALLLRRSRGYVPRAVFLPQALPNVLAVGAELKNTFCLTRGDQAFLSQHIGDLKNAEVLEALESGIRHLGGLLELAPELIAHDQHPDYLSTRLAEEWPEDLPRVAVQHHHAHLASCLAEHGETGPALGVIFDGIGYGADGTLWGGEFLVGDFSGYRRLAHLDLVRMPGGDAATREPRRMALAYLVAAYGAELPDLPLLRYIPDDQLKLLLQMLAKGLNSPLTSSCGRLFDAVAALVGLRDTVSYEGQAALELEMCAAEGERGSYSFVLLQDCEPLRVDLRPLIRGMVADLQQGVAADIISARFHNSIAELILEVCQFLRQRENLSLVVLSGGVFQNCFLTEKTVVLLEHAGFRVLTHALVPPNDGGLALGQAVIAANVQRSLD